MIKTIGLRNFKGHERAFHLGKFTAITGRNSAGKTAVRDAFFVGVLGKHPDLPKNNKAQMALATDPAKPMGVFLADDQGEEITRNWEPKGKAVGYTYNGTVDAQDRWQPWLVSALRPDQFVTASNKDRLAMIAHLAGGKALDKLRLDTTTANSKLKKPLTPDEDPVAFADQVAAAYEAKTRDSSEVRRRFEGTLQGLEQMALKAGQPKKGLADEVKAAQQAVFAAEAKAKAARQRMEAMDRALEAAEEARTSNSAMPQALTAPDVDARIAELDLLRERAANAEAQEAAAKTAAEAATKYREKLETERAPLIHKVGGATLARLDEIAGEIERGESLVKPDLENIRAGYDAATKTASTAWAELSTAKNKLAALQKELAGMAQLQCCPKCGAAAAGWQDRVLSLLNGDIEAAEAAVGIADKANTTAAAAQAAALKARDEAQAIVDTINGLDNLRAIVAAAKALSRNEMNYTEAKGKEKEALARYAAAGEAVEQATMAKQSVEQLASTKARWASVLATINAAPKHEDHEQATGASMDADAAHEEAAAKLADLEAAKKASDDAQGFQTQIESARAAALEAAEAETASKTTAKSLREGMDDAVAAAYEPILKACQKFLAGLDVAEVTVANGELGAFVGGHWKPFEILAGTEQLVALCAVQAALTAHRGGTLVVDELSRVDAINKAKLAANLLAAVKAGELAQVLVLDHDREFWNQLAHTDPTVELCEL